MSDRMHLLLSYALAKTAIVRRASQLKCKIPSDGESGTCLHCGHYTTKRSTVEDDGTKRAIDFKCTSQVCAHLNIKRYVNRRGLKTRKVSPCDRIGRRTKHVVDKPHYAA